MAQGHARISLTSQATTRSITHWLFDGTAGLNSETQSVMRNFTVLTVTRSTGNSVKTPRKCHESVCSLLSRSRARNQSAT
eukprot:20952-Heterococcus_DN1.PRE.3